MLAPHWHAIHTTAPQLTGLAVLGVEDIKVRKQGHAGISGMYLTPSRDRTTARHALPRRALAGLKLLQGARFLLRLIDEELL
jgi:hypothetical protein